MKTKPESTLRLTVLYSLPFVLIITALFVLVLIWEEKYIKAEQTLQLRETANALVQQIIVTRRWNAQHGGVYVQVSDKTRPNPLLVDPQRDIETLAGKRYTKMNPAYMTREISELFGSSQGYRFRLTSAKPLNPANSPDQWEAVALRDFEQGAAERMIVAAAENGRIYRFITPLKTEGPCLACHAKQGYRIGDIRGGISVSIPMTASDLLFSQRIRSVRIAATSLWFCITTFIILVSYMLSRKVSREIVKDLELSQLKTIVELAGAAAHEIRQPLTVMITYAEILKMSSEENESQIKHIDTIIAQCDRINNVLIKMQNITEYRTKPYVGNITIVDLDKSAKPGGSDEN